MKLESWKLPKITEVVNGRLRIGVEHYWEKPKQDFLLLPGGNLELGGRAPE